MYDRIGQVAMCVVLYRYCTGSGIVLSLLLLLVPYLVHNPPHQLRIVKISMLFRLWRLCVMSLGGNVTV